MRQEDRKSTSTQPINGANTTAKQIDRQTNRRNGQVDRYTGAAGIDIISAGFTKRQIDAGT